MDVLSEQGSDDVIECGPGGEGLIGQRDALLIIEQNSSMKMTRTMQIIKFITDFELLLKDQVLHIASLVNTQLSPRWQLVRINQLMVIQQELVDKIAAMFYKAQGRLNKGQKVSKMDLDSLLGLKSFEPFVLLYSETVEVQFNIDDSLSELMQTKWTFLDVEGMFHKRVFTLLVNKKCPNKDVEKQILQLISKAIIRSKRFYDFVFTLDFQLVTKGTFGIIFRQKDPFNYYAANFEDSEISIIRIQNGESQLIASKRLPITIELNRWYNVKLTLVKSQITIYVMQERDAKDPNRYNTPTLSQGLSVQDSYFKSGHFGVYTDYLSKIYFDTFNVTPTACVEEPFDDTDYMFMGTITSYYHEWRWFSLEKWYVPSDDGKTQTTCSSDQIMCYFQTQERDGNLQIGIETLDKSERSLTPFLKSPRPLIYE